jgi:predicted transcriptional regulator
MPKLTREYTEIVTVKLRPDDLAKLDAMAVRLHRSRANMVRALIDAAQLTGHADIRVAGVDDDPVCRGDDAA